MAKKFIQPGEVWDHTPGADVAVDAVVVMGEVVGVALGNIKAGETGSVQVSGVWELPKLSSDNVTQGVILYWDAGNNRLTTTAGGLKVAGAAVAAAAAGVATARVKLRGNCA